MPEARFDVLTEGLPAVASGKLTLFSDFEHSGPMWVGEGLREYRQRVEYGGKFLRPPAVQVTLTMWDTARGANQRMEVFADKVDVTGFTVAFRTWADTRVARVAVSWMAVGAVHDPGLWDV